MDLTICTRSNGRHFIKHIISARAGRPMPFTAIQLLTLPSDVLLIKKTASVRNGFRLTIAVPGDGSVLLRVSCVKCASICQAVSISTGGGAPALNGVSLDPRDVSLGRAIIIKRTPVTIARKSAAIFGTSTCHAPRNSVLRRLIGRLPNKRVSRSNGLLVRKGRIGGVLISKGRFFSSSPGTTLGGLPMRVVRGLGTCRHRSSLTHLANVSSNRRRVVLSLSIGGGVGQK